MTAFTFCILKVDSCAVIFSTWKGPFARAAVGKMQTSFDLLLSADGKRWRENIFWCWSPLGKKRGPLGKRLSGTVLLPCNFAPVVDRPARQRVGSMTKENQSMQTKEVQGKLWSTAPADWVKFIEPSFIPMYQEALAQVHLDEEKLLLDAGCGSGLFLSMASATGALLHGIDAATGLLDISKKRLPGAILMSEDLERLPYIDGTFDIVTGFNSFQYAGNIDAALEEASRVVKKRGQVVIGVWDKEEVCDAAMIFGAVSSLLPSSAPVPSSNFALSEEGMLEAICRAFKLKTVSKSSIFCPWQFNSDEELIRGFLSTATCAIAAQTAGESAVKDAILSSSQPFSMADDVYFLRNFFTLLITEKM